VSGELRAGIDATPLLGPRTGIGHYVANLVAALAALPQPPELVLVPFSWRGAGELPRAAPPAPPGRLRTASRRAPARLLRAAWARLDWPPVEWLCGRVDVFHGTNFTGPPARRAAGVVTVHDLAYLRFPATVARASLAYARLVARSVARGSVVCTPTAAVAAEVADAYRLPPERVVVTPLGLGPAWHAAHPPAAAWLAERGLPRRYLLFAGSVEPRKGLPTLVAAYRELLAAVPDTPPLVLAGPAGWGQALDLSGLPGGAVRPLGYQPTADLASLVAGAAVLAFPSLYEGFGLPPLEALACGTPVVAADVPALREVLGGHADLVPPGDAPALAAALAKALAGDGGGERERAARRAHAQAFTWERCALATLTAYRRALGE
jgi:glycosyltransferase involved in cell wall biosynthesis